MSTTHVRSRGTDTPPTIVASCGACAATKRVSAGPGWRRSRQRMLAQLVSSEVGGSCPPASRGGCRNTARPALSFRRIGIPKGMPFRIPQREHGLCCASPAAYAKHRRCGMSTTHVRSRGTDTHPQPSWQAAERAPPRNASAQVPAGAGRDSACSRSLSRLMLFVHVPRLRAGVVETPRVPRSLSGFYYRGGGGLPPPQKTDERPKGTPLHWETCLESEQIHLQSIIVNALLQTVELVKIACSFQI